MAKKSENVEQTDQIEQLVLVKFNAKKILGMKRYANRVDLLRVLLKHDKDYTLDAVDAAISDFMKGKVK